MDMIPAGAAAANETGTEDLEKFKDYLSESRFRIRLDDLVIRSVRETNRKLSSDTYALESPRINGADFAKRLKQYETDVRPLQEMASLMGKWTTFDQQATLANMVARMTDNCTMTNGGNTLWLALRWYPISVVMYSAGIAALAADNYQAFAGLHRKKVNGRTRRIGNTGVDIVVPLADAMGEVAGTNAWKCIDEYKQSYAPESEHMIKILRPVMENLMFLGTDYERLFDRYEILRSLIYADVTDSDWGPVGRFGWKYSGRHGSDNPYSELCAEAAQQRDQWGPIKAGLFRGTYSRFEKVAGGFQKALLDRLNWH